MKCMKCGQPVDRESAFDTDTGPRCRTCFFDYAMEHNVGAKLDLKALKLRKAAIEAETSGLLPREILRGLIEEGYDRLVSGKGKFDEEVEQLETAIQKLAGLAVSKNVMQVLEALGKLVEEQQEEVRGTVKRLAAL